MLRTQLIVERRRRARCNEFGGQPRDAAGRELPVALPGSDHVLGVAQAFHDLVRITLRRHRVVAAGQDQRRHAALERCAEIRVDRTARPFLADSSHAAHECSAQVRLRQLLFRYVLLLPARRILAADDGEVHALGDLLCDVAFDAQILRGQRLRIAQRLRFVDHQRQRRHRFIGVTEQSNRGTEARCVERRARERAGERMRNRQLHRVLAQLLLQRCELRGDVGKFARACLIASATLQGAVDRTLRFDRDVGSECDFRRHGTIENRRAHPIRIATHVVLRDSRAVRDAVEIQRAIAERGAHVVEIADGDAGRVVARIARQRRQALLHRCLQLLRIEHDEFGIVRQLAVQPVRAPGAPLIDQHQVAVAPDARERRRDAQVEIAGGLSGSAAQDEQRIGRGLQPQRRDRRRRAIAILCYGGRRDFPARGTGRSGPRRCLRPARSPGGSRRAARARRRMQHRLRCKISMPLT